MYGVNMVSSMNLYEYFIKSPIPSLHSYVALSISVLVYLYEYSSTVLVRAYLAMMTDCVPACCIIGPPSAVDINPIALIPIHTKLEGAGGGGCKDDVCVVYDCMEWAGRGRGERERGEC